MRASRVRGDDKPSTWWNATEWINSTATWKHDSRVVWKKSAILEVLKIAQHFQSERKINPRRRRRRHRRWWRWVDDVLFECARLEGRYVVSPTLHNSSGFGSNQVCWQHWLFQQQQHVRANNGRGVTRGIGGSRLPIFWFLLHTHFPPIAYFVWCTCCVCILLLVFYGRVVQEYIKLSDYEAKFVITSVILIKRKNLPVIDTNQL